MEHVSRTAQAVRQRLENAVQTAEISTTRRSSECACGGDGWIRIVEGGRTGVKRCICARRLVYEQYLNAIPARFRLSSFENYVPMDPMQERALSALKAVPHGSFFLWGNYGRGKTHLATAQYRALIEGGQSCAFRSMGELLRELTDAVVRDETSTVIQSARYAESFHLFIDDIDKFKSTEFKHEALFDLLDTLYKRKLGLTITSNYGLGLLVEMERVHPAIVRRIDDMCRAVQV